MRWADMDAFGHVNNAAYLSYLEEARSAYVAQALNWNWAQDRFLLAHVSIDYMRELKYGDPVQIFIRISRVGTKSFDLEYLVGPESGQNPVAAARTVQVMVGPTGGAIPIPPHIRALFQKTGPEL